MLHYYATQVRVSGYGGWFLLRLSLHDPVLPLNIEVVLSSLFFQSSNLRKQHSIKTKLTVMSHVHAGTKQE